MLRRLTSVLVVLVPMGLWAGAPAALASGDANRTECPASTEASPGFRAYLPDCRAYEMVSPPYKDGFLSQVTYYTNGSLVLARSLGAFAGGPDIEGLANDYEFRRAASGWETVALDPQPTQYVVDTALFGGPYGTEAIGEDGMSLMELHTPLESEYGSNLYLRGPSGAVSLMGAALPPSAVPSGPTGIRSHGEGQRYAGASADLSHVFFTITLQKNQLPPGVTTNLWPGDTSAEGAQSLYEYVGTGNARPRLVGLDNGSHLISQCGIQLGGRSPKGPGDVHNAVAAGGTVVLFTAVPARSGCSGGPSTFELFARIDGKRTVAISEPSATDCSTCNVGVPSAANFEGASQDGSKVFFSTTQPLLSSDTDATNDLYEYDSERPEGHRIVQISVGGEGDATPGTGASVQGVAAVSEDGSHVYFVARGVLATNAGAAIDPVSGLPEHATKGKEDLYLFERDARFPAGRTTFIATLASSDSGQWRFNAEAPMETTPPEGRFLVFTSSADLVLGDTNTGQQVFRYDAENGELNRISIGNDGYNHNGNGASFSASIPRASFAAEIIINRDAHPAVSNDGSIVVFTSSEALTPQAIEDPTNSIGNVYEYRDGHVYLISDGRDTIETPTYSGTHLQGVDPSGQDIFIESHDALVPQDTDSLGDVYDVRAGGGFPGPAGVNACSGDGCQNPLGVTPALLSAGSATQPAGGNVVSNVEVSTHGRKPLTQAQRLAKALKVCRKGPKRQRPQCIRRAKKRYGAKPAKKNTRRRK